MRKKSKIVIEVELDENKIPEKINWSAADGGVENEETPLLMLNIWDAKEKECLKIDLWTKELPITEMQSFFLQTLVAMSDTYEKATGDKKTADFLRETGAGFSEHVSDYNSLKK